MTGEKTAKFWVSKSASTPSISASAVSPQTIASARTCAKFAASRPVPELRRSA